MTAAMAAAGCTTATDGGSSAAPAAASVTLLDATGATKATATLTGEGGGVRIVIDASGLATGAHGLHLHIVGRCDPPDFASAGAHWNPTGHVHGKDAPGGPHMGDLPNLIVGTDGRGHVEATIAGATLTAGTTPLLDADGAALVIHANPDDYRTDPSGNSGGRIACGVVSGG